jgi:hypothetical protein
MRPGLAAACSPIRNQFNGINLMASQRLYRRKVRTIKRPGRHRRLHARDILKTQIGEQERSHPTRRHFNSAPM